ncbi:MAG TPA: hypothetical protein VJC18_10030, partial [bacterium]|nr:hypothetical protein [bacterium]
MTKLLLLTTSCVICLVIAGCGGGQDDFEQLQSLSPINELIGTWEIEGIANKATLTMDGEATPDDGNFMTFASNITIT